jgi:transposase InsO family protein
MDGGFLYLVAVMDWFSRFVLSWELSNTMETGFCLAALDSAFRFGQPERSFRDRRGISHSTDSRIRRTTRPDRYELLDSFALLKLGNTKPHSSRPAS